MKNFKNVFLILFGLTVFTCGGQSYDSPVEYLGVINIHSDKIKNDMWDYSRAIAHDKGAHKIESNRKDIIKTIQEAQKTIGAMPGYNGDASYRDTVLNFLELTYHIMTEDYAKIVDMEEIAENSYDLMEAYLNAQQAASEKQAAAGERLIAGQKKFAENNNINLIIEEDKTAIKLAKANEVFDYYQKIYLIFFKANKQELYLIDAMNRQDISAMEQNNATLLQFAEEGIAKLKEVKPYDGDNSLIKSTMDALNFYKEEAKTMTPKQIDYFLDTEQFNSIQKALDKKPENKRTQQDIDKFNAAVAKYNESVNVFNQVNETANNKRNVVISAWNNSAKNFTKRHIDAR